MRDEEGKCVFSPGESHGLKKDPPIRGKVAQAIQLYTLGDTKTAIAKKLGVSINTVFKWLECENVKEAIAKAQEEQDKEFRAELHRRSKSLYNKALGVMGDQLDSENDWIKQNAARDLLTRFQTDITGNEANTVTVHVIGMPEIGESDGKDDA